MNLVYSDKEGRIYDDSSFYACAFNGKEVVVPDERDYIKLPEYSKIFFIPASSPVGMNKKTGRIESIRQGKMAVSAFMRSGYLRLYHPAFKPAKKREYLPLWAYSSVAFDGNSFAVPALLIDDCHRWNPDNYDDRDIIEKMEIIKKKFKDNRLIKHLENCALNYHCFAAKNLFLERWEAPLPVSGKCNSRCLGCISYQDKGMFPASHKRIKFKPSVKDIVEIALHHLESAEDGIVSFGQGCEGEPLMESALIEESIKEIRKGTKKGIIHINTNGFSPERIIRLAKAGLDSIRISVNSTRENLYMQYYRPIDYKFKDVVESIRISVKEGLYTSINYLVFPGITDEKDEWNKLKDLIERTKLHYIQLKNLNIDPLFYIDEMKKAGALKSELMGMKNIVSLLKKNYPDVKLGYFNRTKKEIVEHLKKQKEK